MTYKVRPKDAALLAAATVLCTLLSPFVALRITGDHDPSFGAGSLVFAWFFYLPERAGVFDTWDAANNLLLLLGVYAVQYLVVISLVVTSIRAFRSVWRYRLGRSLERSR